MRILFVCHGNICRSPAAEAIMTDLIKKAGLEDKFFCDSAGIIGYHAGEKADLRMIQHAKKRNYQLTSISRPVETKDFSKFDYIIGMDNGNISGLRTKAPDDDAKNKIRLMTDYCKRENPGYVPDPYYGGAGGFELVLDILEDACANLLAELKGEI